MILVSLMMVTGSSFAAALMALIVDLKLWDTGPNVAIGVVWGTFLAVLMICQCRKNRRS